jgi:hypothetical protein
VAAGVFLCFGIFVRVNGPDAGPQGAVRRPGSWSGWPRRNLPEGRYGEQAAADSFAGGGSGPNSRGQGAGPDHGGIWRSGQAEPGKPQVGRRPEPQVQVGADQAPNPQKGQGQALTGQKEETAGRALVAEDSPEDVRGKLGRGAPGISDFGKGGISHPHPGPLPQGRGGFSGGRPALPVFPYSIIQNP